jgi:hypothetical protein
VYINRSKLQNFAELSISLGGKNTIATIFVAYFGSTLMVSGAKTVQTVALGGDETVKNYRL